MLENNALEWKKALVRGELEEIQAIVASHSDFLGMDITGTGQNIFLWSVNTGRIALVKFFLNLIKEGIVDSKYINAKDQFGWSPLAVAVDSKNIDLIKLLLDSNADIENVEINFSNADVDLTFQGKMLKQLRPYQKTLMELLSSPYDELSEKIIKLLRSYGVPEVESKYDDDTNLSKAIEEFFSFEQSTYFIQAEEAVNRTIFQMMAKANLSETISIDSDGNAVILNKEAHQNFIGQYLPEFYNGISSAYVKYIEVTEYDELEKGLTELAKHIKTTNTKDYHYSIKTGIDSLMLYSLIAFSIKNIKKDPEMRQELYLLVLKEASAASIEYLAQSNHIYDVNNKLMTARACNLGFFNTIALSIPDFSINPVELILEHHNTGLEYTKQIILIVGDLLKLTVEIIIARNPDRAEQIIALCSRVPKDENELQSLSIKYSTFQEYRAELLEERKPVTLWLRGKIKDFITDNFSLYSKYWKEFDKKIPSQHSLSELRIIPNNAMKNNEKEQKHSKHLSKAEGISSGREDELASGYHFFDYQYHNAKYWVDDARVKSSKAHFLSKCYQVIDRMITPAKQVVGGHNNFIESFLLLNEKYLADESSDNNCKENGFAAQFAMALHSINMCIKEKASQNNKRMKNDYDSVVQSMLDKAKYVDEEDKLCIAQKLANFFNYIKYLSCSDSKDSTFALEVCDLYNSMQPADQLVHNELTNFENQMLDISSLIL